MAATVAPDLLVSPELNYKILGYKHPSYRYQSIPQQSGGTAVAIPPTATQESIWQLPIKAFSLSESYLTGVLTPVAGVAATTVNWLLEHAPFISEIYLYTASGKFLVQISNQSLINYQVVTRPPNTSIEDFLSTDSTERLYPIKTIGAVGDAGSGQRFDNTAADRPYFDPKQLTVGTVQAANPAVNFVIKLGQIKDTILSMKKTFLFPETMFLRVQWGPAQKFMFTTTTSLVDPATTAAGPAPGGGGAVAANISQLSFYLAVENDMEIVGGLQQQINSGGISMPIPYVSVLKTNVQASTNQVVNVTIGPSYGHKIKKIVHSVFNNTENTNVAVDHSNIAGAKVNSYQTFMDSNPLQIKAIDCTINSGIYDDYALHKAVLRGTVLQTRNLYQFHWFHQDDWSSLPIAAQKQLPNPAENLVSGLDVGTGRLWSFQATTENAAHNHYTFIITYKTMVITPGNVDIVP